MILPILSHNATGTTKKHGRFVWCRPQPIADEASLNLGGLVYVLESFAQRRHTPVVGISGAAHECDQTRRSVPSQANFPHGIGLSKRTPQSWNDGHAKAGRYHCDDRLDGHQVERASRFRRYAMNEAGGGSATGQ